MTAMRRPRAGFALAAVLWVLTVGTVLAGAAALQGRSAYDASRNRVNAERAYWLAEGCVAEQREAIDRALAAASPITLDATWRTLDTVVAALGPPSAGCQVTLRSVGSAIDVNGASEALLHKYFLTAAGAGAADALTDALLDWRDADDSVRASGAERAWYMAGKLPAPRNDSLASIEELRLVRGFDSRPDLAQYLSVEPSRVCLTTAPAPVLAALPGFIEATVYRVLADRTAGVWFGDLNALRGRLPQAAAESLLVHFPELAVTTTVDPDGWILAVTATSGTPPIGATAELRLDRYANRAVVVRRRTQ
jgi:type II secretory pathway component PulK